MVVLVIKFIEDDMVKDILDEKKINIVVENYVLCNKNKFNNLEKMSVREINSVFEENLKNKNLFLLESNDKIYYSLHYNILDDGWIEFLDTETKEFQLRNGIKSIRGSGSNEY